MSSESIKSKIFQTVILSFALFLIGACSSDNSKIVVQDSVLIQTISSHIDNYGDINKQNENGFLPLTYATYFNDREATFFVLEKGGDPNILDGYGFAPLHWATIKGSKSVIDDLINFGASVNMENSYGETPLFLAMKNGHTDISKTLISKGADLNSVTKYNQTTYSLLPNVDEDLRTDISKNHMGIRVRSTSGFPRRNSDELNRALRVAASEGRAIDVEGYLRQGAQVNARSAFGRSALLFAAQNGHFDVVRTLLSFRETQLVTRDRYNKTAAEYALEHGHPHISEFIQMAILFDESE